MRPYTDQTMIHEIEYPDDLTIEDAKLMLKNSAGYIRLCRQQLDQAREERDQYKKIVENIRGILK